MKQFRFRFEAVEKVRKKAEDEALRALADAQRALLGAKSKHQDLLSQLERALLRREALAREPVTPTAYVVETNYITGTKQQIVRAEQAILRATRGVEKAMRLYVSARRKTRMIELLRENALADFKKAIAKDERKLQDDLYVMRAGTAQAGSGEGQE